MIRLSDITLGRYLPGDSRAHAMDARLKVLLVGLLSVAVWMTDTWAGLGVLCLVVAFWVALAGLPARAVLANLVSLAFVALLAVLYYLWSGWSASGGGWAGALKYSLERSGLLICRLAVVLTAAAWLSLSTAPLKVAEALGRLLRPLEKLKLPVSEFSFLVGLILRAFPEALTRIAATYRTLGQRARLSGAVPPGKNRSLRMSAARVTEAMVLYMQYTLYESERLSLSLMARGYNPFRPVQPGEMGRPAAWEILLSLASSALISFAALRL